MKYYVCKSQLSEEEIYIEVFFVIVILFLSNLNTLIHKMIPRGLTFFFVNR